MAAQKVAAHKLCPWARNLNQEVVLVTIDLARVLAAKWESARQLNSRDSIMKNWGLHKDALAAWLVFQDALSQERGIAAIFERVREYYRRHWFLPARLSRTRSESGDSESAPEGCRQIASLRWLPTVPRPHLLALHQRGRHDLLSEKIHLRRNLKEGLDVRGRPLPVSSAEAFQYHFPPTRFRQRRPLPTCLL